jgi:SsrA-binding protein
MNHEKKSGEKIIATNPIARTNYFIDEVVEAGIILMGTEIKSLRTQTPGLRDAFVDVISNGKKIEAWLLNTHIGPYSHGNLSNHEPLRKRKLLLHRRQLEKLLVAVLQKGKTIVPTRMYLKNGYAKIEIALAKGKKRHDKREALKKKSIEREMASAKKRRGY